MSKRKIVDTKAAQEAFVRGLEFERNHQTEEAKAAYLQSVALNPKAAGAWINLGTIAFKEKQLDEALKCYRLAIAKDPKYSLAHFNLGNALEEQGDLDGARLCYYEALKCNPKYADAFFNLALISSKRGYHAESIGFWNSYLQLDSSGKYADIARNEIKKILNSFGPKCSFCGKYARDCSWMIASPKSFPRHTHICNECVEVCVSILKEKTTPTPDAGD